MLQQSVYVIQEGSTYQSYSRLLICRKAHFIENHFSFFVIESHLRETKQ